MITCETVLELLPWYVIGRVSADEAIEVAGHLRTCEACRTELAEVVWVRRGVLEDASLEQRSRQRVWRHVARQTGIRDTAQIDVGSFLVGFRLGLNTRRRGAPVQANLRLLGQDVRIIGRKRRPAGEGIRRTHDE